MAIGNMVGGNGISGGQKMTSKEAAKSLSNLIENKMGVAVDPVAIALFLKAYWSRASVLAHVIHEEE